jgi:hypothetical protein
MGNVDVLSEHAFTIAEKPDCTRIFPAGALDQLDVMALINAKLKLGESLFGFRSIDEWIEEIHSIVQSVLQPPTHQKDFVWKLTHVVHFALKSKGRFSLTEIQRTALKSMENALLAHR